MLQYCENRGEFNMNGYATRPTLSVIALAALLTASRAGAEDPPAPHLPPPPVYNGTKDRPNPPLPCRPSAPNDLGARIDCVEEQLARMQVQLDRMEQSEEHLARLLDRAVNDDRRHY
jgi:hypothetical protein